jgi:diacylglycerol kinase (ATP)
LPFLLRLPAFRMRLTRVSDKQVNENDAVEAEKLTLLAAFANTQFYGDGMRIAPQADFADGKLDICRIHKLSPLKLLGMFPTVYFGRHLLLPEVGYSRAERVRVETETPLDLYADGEFVCRTPAEISVAAGALRVIYPAR